MTDFSLNTLVLDFGGVISKTLFEIHAAVEKALGLREGSLKWCGLFDPSSDPLWRSVQADEIAELDHWLLRS